MLQRAASNAYTWWWASNIRSKQSKWLDNDLQEMEERVKTMVKLIEEDADSFAKKAEMYYKRRPELISRVEETFKAYKALADRYDRISGELHKANHTIATVLPDQVQFMEDEDDDRPPKEMPSINSTKFFSMSPPPDSTKLPKPPPELPRIVPRGLAGDPQQATKKMHHVRVASFQEIPENVKEEIDKLHKGILILQTEKEFFKGMYERGLTKYWDIERQMTEMQEEVTRLQDEYGASNMIEDDEARALIAATALKSCEDTLITLREQQKRTVEEARQESERIKEATHKLNALKGEGEEEESEEAADKDVASISSAVEEEIESLKNERLELQSVCAKVKQHFELCSDSSVVELAEKIDELVDRVISLEVIVSSLTAQIERLRSETDELHKYLRGLEEEKTTSPTWDDSDSMKDRLKKAEDNLHRIQNLERSVHQQKGVLRIQLSQVCHSLNDLSEKLQTPRQMEKSSTEDDQVKNSNLEDIENIDKKTIQEEGEKKQLIKSQECLIEEGGGDKDWEQLLMNGFEGNEKILLLKCASIIRNYKETKMMLTEIDKKNQECHSETMQQIQELRNANAIKDEEIRALRQRLFSSESWRARSMKKAAAAAAAPHHVQKLEELVVTPDLELGASDELAREVVKICQAEQSTTAVEDKFRADIDTLLEENLDFWLRFSTSYHQIQKFESKFKELQAEIEKVREAKNSSVDDNISLEEAMKQNKIPTDKKLRELNTELQVWLEQNGLLQGELRSRFSSLCSIQEEIARASEEDEGNKVQQQFTRYQAAKFQGEVINMQQENNKVAKELQTGLDHVRGLQVEVGRALSLLHQSFDLSVASKRNHHPIHQFRHLSTKSRIPLRTFLFGVKPKKPSLFSCMNPVYQKHHSDTRHGGVHKRT